MDIPWAASSFCLASFSFLENLEFVEGKCLLITQTVIWHKEGRADLPPLGLVWGEVCIPGKEMKEKKMRLS